jgi:voltage-gated potassium channel Kch
VAGHTPRKASALSDRLGYAFSALGLIDLLAFLPAAIVLATGRHATLAALGVLPFFKLVRYSPAMRSLLAAVQAERRTLVGCVVILIGAVLLFASLLYAVERDVQPDKLGTIPQAMWWAIVTLGTVGYGDVVPVTALGKFISVFTIVSGFAMIALPVAIISTAFAEEVKRRDFVVTWGMLARVPLFSHLSADGDRRHHAAAAGAHRRAGRDPGAAGRRRLVDVFHHRRRGRDRAAEPACAARRRHLLRRDRAAARQAAHGNRRHHRTAGRLHRR